MEDEMKRVELELWEADAVVLRAWLEWVDMDALPVQHRAEKQVLMDLLTRLEASVVIESDKALSDAREAVARGMGW
jgi:hypothetical protein